MRNRRDRLFRDRRDAGRVLAGLLSHYRDRDDVVVLALPRGGVPVAYEVARALRAPLDVFVVRKLGLPRQPELAMGALASGGVVVLNDDIVRQARVDDDTLRRVTEHEQKELLRRERAYRGAADMIDVADKTVVLVDDGLATGASTRAAVRALRQLRPARLVVAVPTAPASTCRELAREVDDMVCASTPADFVAVGGSYMTFGQTTDDEVRSLLRGAEGTPVADTTVAVLRADAVPAPGGVLPDEVLFDLVGDAGLVLFGEASHGTHEFYAARAAMTRRLVQEKGFRAVAVEADWPDAYRVDRYVRGYGEDRDAEEALRGFERFPAWMWRNTEVLEFVAWLRAHNERADEPVGFYGLDLYSLHRSAAQVVAYLEGVDPQAAARARERYSCLEHGEDGRAYARAAAFGAGEDCERRVIAQLTELCSNYRARDDRPENDRSADERFHAERNAQLVRSAEEYYRTMFGGRVSSWNLRDRHMAETLEALRDHLDGGKIVVWAHNSHLGDARATEFASRGELNVGQLVREHHPDDCRLIGFTTYTGTVTAADNWGEEADRKRVRPALPGSVEEQLHEVGGDFALVFPQAPRSARVLRTSRLERAIGVIYRPHTERHSHYFRARPADQFDALIHVDRTTALEPLERTPRWNSGDLPETYPHAV
ncbi:erythromycin esterase family protein [Saccharothrix variisporea]|uniref:Erythromycin esterase-like protein n=1 Tax=Saccharothrix variisporea TaxID=543527 RepID=A0A495X3I6_9PSEU|nr:erythromycin esterase family protein [Saccharothrix variisporea]RKT68562.1 erythromycin esterase-like protein [Saccharothrix variisporea]